MNYEQLKADMEAGTQGDWVFKPHDPYSWGDPDEVRAGHRTICCNTDYYPTPVGVDDQRRIARVPQLERIALAAQRLYHATDFMADNDPDDVVADGGITAIMVGLKEIRKALAAYREATK